MDSGKERRFRDLFRNMEVTEAYSYQAKSLSGI